MFIERDLDRHDTCDFLALLKALLRRVARSDAPSTDDALLDLCLVDAVKISNGEELKRRLTEYTSPKYNTEVDYYAPFVETFNFALKKSKDQFQSLRDAPPEEEAFLFHRNDPKEIIGYYFKPQIETRRKPDVVFTTHASACRAAGEDGAGLQWDDILTKLAPNAPRVGFDWADILLCIEHKRAKKTLSKPPPEYHAKFSSDLPPMGVHDRFHTEDEDAVGAHEGASSARAQPPSAIRTSARLAAAVTGKRKRDKDDHERGKDSKIGEDPEDSRSKPTPPQDHSPAVQCGLYATEMLCRGPYATHAINLLAKDDCAWVWWYDRQGAIQSSGINFVQNLPYFLVLLAIFQRFSLNDWGIDTRLMKNHGEQYIRPEGPAGNYAEDQNPCVAYGDFEFTFKAKGTKVNISRSAAIPPRSQRYSLLGRGTEVYDIVTHDVDGLSLVAKVSWPEKQRASEVAVLQKIDEISNTDALVRDHTSVLEDWDDSEYDTETIRADIKRNGGLQQSDSSLHGGPRVLRILLMRKLEPIWRLDPVDLVRAWLDCVRCHFRLWCRGIEHTDISWGNMMCDPSTKRGVLNDFDLAQLRNEDGASGTGSERTGTLPFMAIDLLTEEGYHGNVTRLYRHDLESCIWVLPYVLLFDRRSDTTQNTILRTWDTADYTSCLQAKVTFLALLDFHPPPAYKEVWENVGLSAVKWLKRYRSALEDEKLGETMTRERQEMVGRWKDPSLQGAIAIFKDFERTLQPGLKKLGLDVGERM